MYQLLGAEDTAEVGIVSLVPSNWHISFSAFLLGETEK